MYAISRVPKLVAVIIEPRLGDNFEICIGKNETEVILTEATLLITDDIGISNASGLNETTAR